jgi:hypothetical protein
VKNENITVDSIPFPVYHSTVMGKHKKEDLPHEVRKLKARGAGLAASTKGRKTTFKDRRKDASRKACRGRSEE